MFDPKGRRTASLEHESVLKDFDLYDPIPVRIGSSSSGTVIRYREQRIASWNGEHTHELASIIKTLGWEFDAEAYLYLSDTSFPYTVLGLKLPGVAELGALTFILREFRKWPVSIDEILERSDQRSSENTAAAIAAVLHLPKGRAKNAFQIFFDSQSPRVTDFMQRGTGWWGVVRVVEAPPAKGSKAKPRLRLVTLDSSETVYESRYPRKEYAFLKDRVNGHVHLGYETFDEGRKYQLCIA